VSERRTDTTVDTAAEWNPSDGLRVTAKESIRVERHRV
jgi:hypothetical protein